MAKQQFAFEEFCDDLGPAKVVHIYDSGCQLRGMLTISRDEKIEPRKAAETLAHQRVKAAIKLRADTC